LADPKHERLEELFRDALAKDSWAERTAFLNAACGDDAELRSHVEGLLKVHGRVGSFLDVPTGDPETTVQTWSPSAAVGTKIGRYKVLQEIGEGGFGVVYMAEQEEPVRRKVALKIIKLGMDTRQVIARFEAERQALALMEHSNIAAVLDAGATETGRPYFVMELVKGVTITEYCEQHKLTTRERLELLVPVCHAVQHAHQKGVIHRDLKPSNVLVTLHDGKPVPKVIDFGIAKATSQRLTDKTLFTEFRQFLGTPVYMSPDQADLSGLDVDTRTDIYSLGVLLYELLTGTTPFDPLTLRQAGYDEIRRIIREVEPPKPSTRVQTLIAAGSPLATRRRSEPAALPRLLRGDLDWIVMKAMEKDRTRRYATAKDLADDIERHLHHEPVAAGPPGPAYKCRKFIRRHRLGALAGVLVGVALLTGLSTAVIGLVQANRARAALELQRNEAEQARASADEQRGLAEASARDAHAQAARSATVSAFLQEMLSSVDPSKALGREVSVRYALDEAARKINEGALSGQPEVEAALRTTLGETYAALGMYDGAETHLRSAQALRSRLLGDEHPDTLRSNRALASLLRVKGQFVEAESLLRRTAEIQRRVLGEQHPDTLATQNELARALWGPGRYAEAEAIHRRTLDIQRRVLGENHADTVLSLGYVGEVCRAQRKFAEAEPLLRRALELNRLVFGEEHPRTADALSNLAQLLEDQRLFEPAGDLYRQAYDVDRRVLGEDHPQTLLALNNLLRALKPQQKPDEIRTLVGERLAYLRRATERPNAAAIAFQAYAWELLNCEPADLRDANAALPVARRAVELDGERDADMLDTLAQAFWTTGDADEAIETQRRAVDRARVSGLHSRADLEDKLVSYLSDKGDLVGAARLHSQQVFGRVSAALFSDSTPGAALASQSEALLKEGRFEEAAAALRGCLAVRQKAFPEGNWLIAETNSQLGAALAGEGKFAEAEPLLLEAYTTLQAGTAPPDRSRAALRRIVQLYESWGKTDRAAEWRQRLQTQPAEAPVDSGSTG
jgi:eukaryotic-like serine/threonine-protein kinase